LPRRRRRARKASARCRRVQIPAPRPLLPYQNRSCRSPRAARSYRLRMNVGAPMRENNSAKNKRTVRHRCKIGAAAISIGAECIRKDFSAPPVRTSAFDPARRPESPFFRRGFPDCAVARIRPCREVNDVDIPSFARTIRSRSRRLSSFIGLDRFLPMRFVVAPEGCA
jgi:hypothetical protein